MKMNEGIDWHGLLNNGSNHIQNYLDPGCCLLVTLEGSGIFSVSLRRDGSPKVVRVIDDMPSSRMPCMTMWTPEIFALSFLAFIDYLYENDPIILERFPGNSNSYKTKVDFRDEGGNYIGIETSRSEDLRRCEVHMKKRTGRYSTMNFISRGGGPLQMIDDGYTSLEEFEHIFQEILLHSTLSDSLNLYPSNTRLPPMERGITLTLTSCPLFTLRAVKKKHRNQRSVSRGKRERGISPRA